MRDRTRSVDLNHLFAGFRSTQFQRSIPQSEIRSSHFRNNEARATLPVKQLKVTKLVLR
jgi:hypothetical protein